MKILTAVDSFKGSISSSEINNIVAKELKLKGLEVIQKPLADGGEGTIDALIDSTNANKIECTVTGGLGEKIKSYYAMMHNGTAVIEIAQICGLPMLPSDKRSPLYTTTYGVGEAIIHALHKGAKHIVIALGGSATNDVGIGMLQALGVTVSDALHQPASFGASSLENITHIDFSTRSPELKNIPISVITDVQNLLCGEEGATFVFGPQKGLSPDDCIKVEKQVQRLCSLTPLLQKYKNTPGAGAAGGLGVACLALGAKIYEGAEWFMKTLQLKETIQQVDAIITGEGKLDSQTLSGKAPISIARYAKSIDKPVIAIAGSIDIQLLSAFYESGIKICLSVLPGIQTLEQAITLSQSQQNITYISQQIATFLTWPKE
ncbi:glycerate kinase [Oceanobacillus timonensis]|uniref:glycerate kinase n=1 Tax=Oceanobacillus timonensis TaxID=1926285 RepID=UPI0009BC0242|nr:glycerate kinase [Oceanobacillus timonensis]